MKTHKLCGMTLREIHALLIRYRERGIDLRLYLPALAGQKDDNMCWYEERAEFTEETTSAKFRTTLYESFTEQDLDIAILNSKDDQVKNAQNRVTDLTYLGDRLDVKIKGLLTTNA